MTIQTIAAGPFAGQQPGTSGLRKKTAEFSRPHYLECFIQAVFDTADVAGQVLVLGGDGRHFSAAATATILRMAAANGVARVIVGQGGLLSTPACSHLIRLRGAHGGLVLSASHNPGGPDGDFGVKFNIANGGPAPEALTTAIHAASERITAYRIVTAAAPDLHRPGVHDLAGMVVEVIDPVTDYADLMASLFDFAAIRALIGRGFTLRFDAMHAVTGPYALEILERRLGAPAGTVMNGIPRPDFGGGHPDPNPIWAARLYAMMMASTGPDFGAASDGDGDRNMILGRGCYVNPSDSLAVLAANAHLVPGYAGGLTGVARSMPTSTAVDRVAASLGIPTYETPTGWKFFGNLLDAGRITLCGEESFGTSSDHVREKDGLWAVLMWLNILAVTGKGVRELLHEHWHRFGRTFYSRHDYEELPADQAQAIMAGLRQQLADLPGRRVAGLIITQADDFAYTDPVDGSTSSGQGLRVILADGAARLVMRLSGTGTAGATLRLYLEWHRQDGDVPLLEPAAVLAPLAAVAEELAGIARISGRQSPDVVT